MILAQHMTEFTRVEGRYMLNFFLTTIIADSTMQMDTQHHAMGTDINHDPYHDDTWDDDAEAVIQAFLDRKDHEDLWLGDSGAYMHMVFCNKNKWPR